MDYKDKHEQEIYAVVSKTLKGIVPNADIAPEKRFIEDIGLDSINRFDAVMSLEEKLGITFPDDDELTKLTVVGDMVKLAYQVKYPEEYKARYRQ